MSERNVQVNEIALGNGIAVGFDDADQVFNQIYGNNTKEEYLGADPNHGIITATGRDERLPKANTEGIAPTREKMTRRNRILVGVGAAVVALTIAAGFGTQTGTPERAHAQTTEQEAAAPAPAAKPVVADNPRANALYGNDDTGRNEQGLIGNFEIDAENPKQSRINFFNDIRKNPEQLGFWNACRQAIGVPSYEACVNNPDVLEKAEKLTADYRDMTAEEKGPIAERVIREFKSYQYGGVINHNGGYRTVTVNKAGEFSPAQLSRDNDLWMKFTSVDQDGKKSTFYVRKCGQIVEDAPEERTITRSGSPAPEVSPTPESEPEPTSEVTPTPEPVTEPTPEPAPEPPVTTPPTTTPPTPTPPTTTPPTPTPPTTTPPTPTPPTTPPELHAPADGPPSPAPVRPAEPTPGHTPGSTEVVVDSQDGDPTDLDRTPNGTEVPDSAGTNGGSPAGGATPEVPTAEDNSGFDPGEVTAGTDEDITDEPTAPQAQTPATPGTTAPGSDTGMPN